MKKRFIFGALVAFLALPLAVSAAVFADKKLMQPVHVNADTYTFTVDSDDFGGSDLTDAYQMNVEQTFGQYAPVLNYYLAKLDADDNLVLAPSGRIYNYNGSAPYGGRLTDILSMTINYTTESGGQLFVQTGVAGDNQVFGEKIAVTSGVALEFNNHPNYFIISNSNKAATITSLSMSYTCNATPGFSLGNLGNKYTGMGADLNTYTLVRDGANVTVAGQTGTIAVTSAGAFTITLAGGAIVYTGQVSADYKTLNFLEKSGAYAASAPTIVEMNRVYVMEDFESYSETGSGYTTNNAAGRQNASGLRAAYYCDYAGGGYTTWVRAADGSNKSSFNYAVSADYLNLTTALKHGGSKAATIKGWKDGWTRAWSIEAFNHDYNYGFGSGNKFSFWTHGAYTDTACTTASSKDVKISVQVYYQDFVVDDNNRKSTTYGSGVSVVTVAAGSDWTEKTITISPSKKVCAVNLMVDNSTLSANVFVPIDDLTIYTQPVFEPTKKYEESATKFTKSYKGSLTLGGGAVSADVKLAVGANGYVYGYAGADMQAQTYSVSGNQMAITTTGSITATGLGTKTYGNWSGTLSDDKSTLTINKTDITGEIASYIDQNQIVLQEDNVLFDGSESTATLQAALTRQYYEHVSGDTYKWTTDTGNSDRILPLSTHYIQGNSSIRVRPYASGNMRVFINPAVAEAQNANIKNVAFWFYAPAGIKYKISIYSYDGYDPETAANKQQQWIQEYTGDADGDYSAGWQYVSMGLKYNKNFAIWVQTNSAATIIDYVTYY